MKKIQICNCDGQTSYECGGLDKGHCPYVTVADCAEVALCAGRHDIPQAVDGVIFGEIEDPANCLHMQAVAHEALIHLGVKYIDLYVTGLTPALIATLNVARLRGVSVVLYHYNRETGDYFSQAVL